MERMVGVPEAIAAELEVLKRSLGDLPEPVAKPVFVFVSGLPGTGKSNVSSKLAQRLPIKVLETDQLRKALWPSPSYSGDESAHLFHLVHLLLGELLRRGICVLLDATNLVERHRERLYSIAEQAGAKLIIVRTEAPPEVVRERLQNRGTGANPDDRSSADWQVYERMRSSEERIRRTHYAVDTSKDLGPALDKIVRETRRWMRA